VLASAAVVPLLTSPLVMLFPELSTATTLQKYAVLLVLVLGTTTARECAVTP
jgi:hypothetical protein